jgi:lipopolysaccharide/colanic/teichoic acid biosynthesis glycosyltransferase
VGVKQTLHIFIHKSFGAFMVNQGVRTANGVIIFEQGLKRLLDLAVASLFLVFFWPVLLLITLWIKLDSPGPAIFSHQRVGKDGRLFKLYKFRSMKAGGDDTGYMNYLKQLIESDYERNGNGRPYRKMEDDERITRAGKFLRKFYLDELPQFWNILRGEMSLVGPRPHVQYEVDCYTPEQRRRLTVWPGATGLWQVKGKADCSFNELIALDLEYINHWRLGLDIKILLATIEVMARGGEGFWTRAINKENVRRQ